MIKTSAPDFYFTAIMRHGTDEFSSSIFSNDMDYNGGTE
jgi:hypothetical protein